MPIDGKTKLSDLKKFIEENSKGFASNEIEYFPYGKRFVEGIQQSLAAEGYSYSLKDIYDIIKHLNSTK